MNKATVEAESTRTLEDVLADIVSVLGALRQPIGPEPEDLAA
jgi:hypothetical protein